MTVRGVVGVIVACGVSLSAGLVGTLAMGGDGPGQWYESLEKPGFTPPNWVFGPVWSVLYVLMGVAAFLVWREGVRRRPVRVALGWFLAQLALNALWTPVFFGVHRVGLALLVIVALWVAILVATYCFSKVSRAAACLLVPYLLWVSYAAVLNASIWHLNR